LQILFKGHFMENTAHKGHGEREGHKGEEGGEGANMSENQIGSVIVDIHKKQLLTYLKLSNMKLGYILNFGAETMKDGIFRIINGSI